MELNTAIRDRIFAAATSLYEQNGGKNFPTVGDVRHLARCNMNDASAGMKEWRRQQTAQAAPIAIIVPEVIQRNAQQTAATLWAQAQELANESLRSAQAGWDVERAEAEELRSQISAEFETQASELTAARSRIEALEVEMKETVQGTTALRHELELTQARVVEADRQATKANSERDQARDEAANLRGQFDTARRDLEKSESGRIKAEAKAQQAIQDATAAQNKVADALSVEKTAVAEAAKAREEVARLSGQLEATQAQNAALLERLGPQGPVSSRPRGRRHSDDPPPGVTSQP